MHHHRIAVQDPDDYAITSAAHGYVSRLQVPHYYASFVQFDNCFENSSQCRELVRKRKVRLTYGGFWGLACELIGVTNFALRAQEAGGQFWYQYAKRLVLPSDNPEGECA